MTPFEVFVIVHFVSDWMFQRSKWAVDKTKNKKHRLYHCLQYTLFFLPIAYFYKLSLLWLIYIFVSHYFIDSYKLTVWWCRVIKGDDDPPFWLQIVIDQILHVLILAIMVAICAL